MVQRVHRLADLGDVLLHLGVRLCATLTGNLSMVVISTRLVTLFQ
ncbi:MAG: hypothetical protein U0744_06200 [Gemmataceae bacterium]